jgi:uncharacterized membrane protein
MILFLALYAFAGLILAALSVPFILYRIPPNGWIGIKVQSSQENPRIWYLVNAYAGKRMLTVGLLTSIAAILLYYLNGNNIEQYAFSCLAVFLALFIWAAITSYFYVKELQR